MPDASQIARRKGEEGPWSGVLPTRASGELLLHGPPKWKGADDNLLQKIRSQVKLDPMNNPALPHGLDRMVPFRECDRDGKSVRKNFFCEKSS